MELEVWTEKRYILARRVVNENWGKIAQARRLGDLKVGRGFGNQRYGYFKIRFSYVGNVHLTLKAAPIQMYCNILLTKKPILASKYWLFCENCQGSFCENCQGMPYYHFGDCNSNIF